MLGSFHVREDDDIGVNTGGHKHSLIICMQRSRSFMMAVCVNCIPLGYLMS